MEESKLLEACIYLIHTEKFAALRQSIVDITDKWQQQPLVFIGALDILNRLVRLGVESRSELDGILHLIERERGRESTRDETHTGANRRPLEPSRRARRDAYQRELMTGRRWRLAAAQELHEITTGKTLETRVEKKRFESQQFSAWQEAKRVFVEKRGGLSATEIAQAGKEFWQNLDDELRARIKVALSKDVSRERRGHKAPRTPSADGYASVAIPEVEPDDRTSSLVASSKRWILDLESMTLSDTKTGEIFQRTEFEEIGYVTRGGTKIEGIGFRDPKRPFINSQEISKRNCKRGS